MSNVGAQRRIDVVAAWISNPRGEILLAQRPPGKAHAGCYEFPGGKIQAGESEAQALAREVFEELNLHVETSEALERFEHVYPDIGLIDLRLHRVHGFRGEARGVEGQALRWIWPALAHRLPLPALDRQITRALCLSRQYLITPEPPAPDASIKARKSWLLSLEKSVAAGARLVLLRSKLYPVRDLRSIATLARDCVHHQGGEILLQDDVQAALDWRFGGVSLTAKALRKLAKSKSMRPVPETQHLAASCHSAEELGMAAELGCDFVTLAPVQETQTHPGQPGMGWSSFKQLCETRKLPIYALGGLEPGQLDAAQSHGAFGVAGISSFWARS
jgi:8-oxo-dGTP diphosphatase